MRKLARAEVRSDETQQTSEGTVKSHTFRGLAGRSVVIRFRRAVAPSFPTNTGKIPAGMAAQNEARSAQVRSSASRSAGGPLYRRD